jgi:cytochrome c biogenesis factor
MGTPIGAPDVRTTPGYDLYVSLMSVTPEGVGLHVYQKPLIVWIWIGAGLAALGTLFSLTPLRWLQGGRVVSAEAAVAASK